MDPRASAPPGSGLGGGAWAIVRTALSTREFREGSNQNYLRDEDVARIAATGHAFEDVERYARVVEVEEIERNDFNLNIGRYAEAAEDRTAVDVAAAIATLRVAESDRVAAKARMDGFIRELGYE